MGRLIDADALGIGRCSDKVLPRDYCAGWNGVAGIVERAPTFQPEPGWISVKDRLPEEKGTYLVYAPTYSGGSSSGLDNVRGVMFARWKNHWSIEVGYHKRPGCVTHWMPLPQPPKEADNA